MAKASTHNDFVDIDRLTIKAYSGEDKALWNAFVASSKNGTFLFHRDYMDYHAERFEDASLIAFDDRGNARALLPATRHGDELISHGGLTYGGFLTDEHITVASMLDLFEATVRHLGGDGVRTLLYKTAPYIYHRSPAGEDLYALFVHGAELNRRDILSVIDYGGNLGWRARTRRRRSKAARVGIRVRDSDEYERFWPVLEANLTQRYGTRPVHSLEEIQLLAGRFPAQIRLFAAYLADELEAGIVLYLSDNVCHVQYSGTSAPGRDHGALDLLYADVIEACHGRVRYFDFGISTEQEGRLLNTGLIEFKQHFGARAVAHDFYRLTIPVP